MTNTDLLSANPKRPRGATDQEARLFAEIARATPFSEVVKGVEFRLDRDSDGDPAVWIVVLTDVGDYPSDEEMTELNRAGETLRAAVLNSDIDRWPYVLIEPA